MNEHQDTPPVMNHDRATTCIFCSESFPFLIPTSGSGTLRVFITHTSSNPAPLQDLINAVCSRHQIDDWLQLPLTHSHGINMTFKTATRLISDRPSVLAVQSYRKLSTGTLRISQPEKKLKLAPKNSRFKIGW